LSARPSRRGRWQLFFQQSNIIDKRITPRFISYERIDTVLGSVVVVIGAASLMVTAAWAAGSTGTVGRFTDAGGIAHLLATHSRLLGSIFAVVLLDASIIGAAAVTLATSYAFGDVFNMRHSLHRGFAEAKKFYASYTAMIVAAAVITLLPGAPLGLITTSVQALAGLLLPSASVFLLLLCNDREVLGPWVNPRWLNAIATLIVAVLLLLSGILMATTLFPTINVVTVSAQIALAMVILGALTAAGLKFTQHHRPAPSPAAAAMSQADKLTWRMPQLALLQPVRWSAGTKVGMLALRGYLVVGAVLLFVKAVQLAGG